MEANPGLLPIRRERHDYYTFWCRYQLMLELKVNCIFWVNYHLEKYVHVFQNAGQYIQMLSVVIFLEPMSHVTKPDVPCCI